MLHRMVTCVGSSSAPLRLTSAILRAAIDTARQEDDTKDPSCRPGADILSPTAISGLQLITHSKVTIPWESGGFA